jgi:hypothetical protein
MGAALMVAAPVHAQEAEPFVPAFNSDSDLDCAIFIGALMAETEAEMTPDNRLGLTSAFTYFVGRYEAQRGIEITEAFTGRYPIYLELNPVEIQQTCSVRMRAFGARLQEAGSALSRLTPQRDPVADEAADSAEEAPAE